MQAMRALTVDPPEHSWLAVRLRERGGETNALIFPRRDIRVAHALIPDGWIRIATIFAVG